MQLDDSKPATAVGKRPLIYIKDLDSVSSKNSSCDFDTTPKQSRVDGSNYLDNFSNRRLSQAEFLTPQKPRMSVESDSLQMRSDLIEMTN
jgi:hypothetical protein